MAFGFSVIHDHKGGKDTKNVLREILGEVYEIDGGFDDVAIRTFKVSLPAEYDLRKSLTRKPVRSVR